MIFGLSLFEAGMLICFGIAWPISIYKSLKSRSTGGKSIFFTIVVDLGYVCGIVNKILYNPDIVLYLYILNFLMVTFDLILYIRNRRYELAAKQEAVPSAQEASEATPV